MKITRLEFADYVCDTNPIRKRNRIVQVLREIEVDGARFILHYRDTKHLRNDGMDDVCVLGSPRDDGLYIPFQIVIHDRIDTLDFLEMLQSCTEEFCRKTLENPQHPGGLYLLCEYLGVPWKEHREAWYKSLREKQAKADEAKRLERERKKEEEKQEIIRKTQEVLEVCRKGQGNIPVEDFLIALKSTEYPLEMPDHRVLGCHDYDILIRDGRILNYGMSAKAFRRFKNYWDHFVAVASPEEQEEECDPEVLKLFQPSH